MNLQSTLNSSFRINTDSKAAEAVAAVSAGRGAVLRTSSWIVGNSPAAKVVLSAGGVEVLMSWADGTRTLVHVNIPLVQTSSMPVFQDFSSVDTSGRDIRVRFEAHNAETRAAKLKAGEPAILLKVKLSLAGEPDNVIEYFTVFRKGDQLFLGHSDVSARALMGAVAMEAAAKNKPTEPDVDEGEIDLRATTLPDMPKDADDTASWDIDDLLAPDNTPPKL